VPNPIWAYSPWGEKSVLISESGPAKSQRGSFRLKGTPHTNESLYQILASARASAHLGGIGPKSNTGLR